MILRAGAVAREAHRGQTRKVTGKPYVTHCARVGSKVLILENGHLYPNHEELVCGAILHDTVEDTDLTIEDIIREFNEETGRIVAGLTDMYTKDAYPKLVRKERKKLEHEKISKLTTDIKLIKLIDRTDNLEEMTANDNFLSVYLAESKLLMTALNKDVQPLYAKDFGLLFDELKTTIEHWEHLIHG